MNGKQKIALALLLAALVCLSACGEKQTPSPSSPPDLGPSQGTPGDTNTQPTDPVVPDTPAVPDDPNKNVDPPVVEPDPVPVEPPVPAVVYTSASPADLVVVTGVGEESREHVLTLGNFSWIYKDYKGDMETNQVQGVQITEAGVVDLGSLSVSALSAVRIQLPEGVTAVKQSLLDSSGNLVQGADDGEGFLSAEPGSYLYELLATYSSGSQVQYMARITYTE